MPGAPPSQSPLTHEELVELTGNLSLGNPSGVRSLNISIWLNNARRDSNLVSIYGNNSLPGTTLPSFVLAFSVFLQRGPNSGTTEVDPFKIK